MQKSEIVSHIDAEKYQENLEEGKATFDQLRQTFDLKRKAAQARFAFSKSSGIALSKPCRTRRLTLT